MSAEAGADPVAPFGPAAKVAVEQSVAQALAEATVAQFVQPRVSVTLHELGKALTAEGVTVPRPWLKGQLEQAGFFPKEDIVPEGEVFTRYDPSRPRMTEPKP